jgi:preprotein translocase subunit Sec63
MVYNRGSAKLDNARTLARTAQIDQMLRSQHVLAEQQIAYSISNNLMIREQNTHLVTIADKFDGLQDTSWTILGKATQILNTIVEVKSMVNVVFQWVLVQRHQYPMYIGLDPTLHKPLILEDALGNIVEIPLSIANSWNVSPVLLITFAYS